MNGSSGDPAEVLAKVRPQQVFLLLEILREVALPQRELVSARYSEKARHFPETVQFAQSLGWVCTSGQALQLSGGAPARILSTPAAVRGPFTARTKTLKCPPVGKETRLAAALTNATFVPSALSVSGPTSASAPAVPAALTLARVVVPADRPLF